MEDDDEFGDLYTDVLRPFSSPSSSAPHPHQSSPAPAPPSLDLNLNASQIPYDAPHANSPAPDQLHPVDLQEPPHSAAAEEPKIEPLPVSKLDSGGGAGDEGVDPMDRDVKFDIEEEEEEDGGGEPIIPGLSGAVVAQGGGGEGDDWDSDDSEDDLKIVLNENNHMAMERGGMGDGDEEEEDEDEGLVIVGGDPNQGAEEQEWGENSALASGDGERKDAAGELAKAGGGAMAPKIGYSNHGYHPFHSQFKVSGVVVVLC